MKDFNEKGMKYAVSYRAPGWEVGKRDMIEHYRSVHFTGKINDNDFSPL